ncbi:MAG TPA: tRNA (N6-threonylcarbamoyladenosine(37)-N6)-methyltransferase TrmO [Symbiobacteriaceae bacterium]|nr:tRNA (N6-threonylcarbamoyladenosine(37)-N6)-methyltransferase TrmO [Symbiobacteriaceae bacterium]
MQMVYPMQPIGFVHSPYTETSQIPKGCGARHEADGSLQILPAYQEGLTDIEGFSHLYVLWVFDRVEGFELLATPPTDTRPHGVFATRSPRRPNRLGLTVVELVKREGSRLRVRGIDMLDGTPILDLKPYLSSVAQEQLRRGWLAEAERRTGE